MTLTNPKDRRRLETIADRLLAKSGFFGLPVYGPEPEYRPVDPDMIGIGGLKPVWVGKANPDPSKF